MHDMKFQGSLLPHSLQHDFLDTTEQLQLESFYQRFVWDSFAAYGEGHLILACYATLPAALSTDLVYRLWLNFNRYFVEKEPQFIDHIAVSDLLLSSIAHPLGNGLFEIPFNIRRALQKFWKSQFEGSHSKSIDKHEGSSSLTLVSLDEVARLLLEYADTAEAFRFGDAFVQAQKWTAGSVLDPQSTARELTRSFQEVWQSDSKQVRRLQLGDAIKKMSDRISLGLIDRAPQEEFEDLYTMTRLAEYLSTDATEQAAILLQKNVKPEDLKDKPDPKAAASFRIVGAIVPDKKVFRGKSTVHALLIGINEYEYSPLKSTLNDIYDVEDILSEYTKRYKLNLRIRRLVNKAANRTNILDLITGTNDQIKPGDVVYIYFGGHSSRQEGCPGYLLSYDMEPIFDVEIGWIVWKLTQKYDVSVVIVIDAGHIDSLKQVYRESVPIHLGHGSKEKNWRTKLIGYDDYQFFVDAGERFYTAPVGRYVLFAGTRRDQVGYERPIGGESRGIFTHCLMDVLRKSLASTPKRQKTAISYLEMLKRSESDLSRTSARQNPQIEVGGGMSVFSGFLGVDGSPAVAPFTIQCDKFRNWIIDVGTIFNNQIAEARFALEDGTPIKVVDAQATTSRISGVPQTYDISQSYGIWLSYIPQTKTSFFIFDVKVREELNMFLEKISEEESLSIQLLEDRNLADYHVHFDGNGLWLSYPDGPVFPLFEPVQFDETKGGLRLFIERLEHVAEWNALLHKDSVDSDRLNAPLELEIFDAKGKNQRLDINQKVSLELGSQNDHSIQFKLKNTTDQTLWAAVLFLSEGFGVTSLLPSTMIEPHFYMWMTREQGFRDARDFPLTFPEEYDSWDVNSVSNYLKVLVSNKQFRTYEMLQESLFLSAKNGQSGTRGAGSFEYSQKSVPAWWTAQTITIELIRGALTPSDEPIQNIQKHYVEEVNDPDQELWTSAESEDLLSHYQRYLKEYPDSDNVEQAKEAIVRITHEFIYGLSRLKKVGSTLNSLEIEDISVSSEINDLIDNALEIIDDMSVEEEAITQKLNGLSSNLADIQKDLDYDASSMSDLHAHYSQRKEDAVDAIDQFVSEYRGNAQEDFIDERMGVFDSAKNYLLLIGIDEYQDSNSIPKLHNAVKDAMDFKQVLLKKYQFIEEYVTQIYNEEATKKGIFRAFRELRKRIIPEKDNIVIYYSGHGHFDKSTNQGYWMPTDAVFKEDDSYIENSSIINSFIKPLNTKHTLLISDACFSGSIFSDGMRRKSGFDSIRELYKRKSRWAFCSGRQDEEVHDGKPGSNSPFAQSLIEYLDSSEDDKINIAKVANHVIEVIANEYQQLPNAGPIFNSGHMGGQFIFQRKGVKPLGLASNGDTSIQGRRVQKEFEKSIGNTMIEREAEPFTSSTLVSLISNRETRKALELMMAHTQKSQNANLQNDLIMLSGRFNRLDRDNKMGTIANKTYSIEVNKINAALLDLISGMEE